MLALLTSDQSEQLISLQCSFHQKFVRLVGAKAGGFPFRLWCSHTHLLPHTHNQVSARLVGAGLSVGEEDFARPRVEVARATFRVEGCGASEVR